MLRILAKCVLVMPDRILEQFQVLQHQTNIHKCAEMRCLNSEDVAVLLGGTVKFAGFAERVGEVVLQIDMVRMGRDPFFEQRQSLCHISQRPQSDRQVRGRVGIAGPRTQDFHVHRHRTRNIAGPMEGDRVLQLRR